MKAIETIRQELLVNRWTVKPGGYYRHSGITGIRGSERFSVDLDRMGRVLGWVRWQDTGVIHTKSNSSDPAKLAGALGQINREEKAA